MKVISNIRQMQRLMLQLRKQNKSLGLVPTMGYLHQGHMSLIKQAKCENDFVVVSIFVNPTQFGPTEDLSQYPRDFKRDKKIALRQKVDCIFYPKAKDMYPKGYKTSVYVDDLDRYLCGLFRPGHFKGVTTVIAKLFNIVNPDIAYFGQKDAQQALIIEKLTKDLDFNIKVRILPTIREKNGLAMSSRNKYLSSKEREEAAILYSSLKKAKAIIKGGARDVDKIKEAMSKMINKKKTGRIQYIEIVDTENLKPVNKIKGKVLIATACYFGRTRLIDNIMVEVK